MKQVPKIIAEYPHIIESFPWLHVALTDDLGHPLAKIVAVSDLIRDDDPTYLNPDLVDLDRDLAELAGTPGLLKLTLSMSDKGSFFDHRASLWFGAKYMRAGKYVEFIRQYSGKQTPDLLLRDKRTSLTAFLEVKHVDLDTSLMPIIEKIREVPSQYSVRLSVNAELPYANQAENVARIVTDKLRSISIDEEDQASHHFVMPGIGEFDLIRNNDGKKDMTGVMITSPRIISIPKICERLSQLIDKARTQLTSYSHDGINVICLYVDDLTIKPDIAETTLNKKPGLFGLHEYSNIAAVKYVRQMVGHEEILFVNANNSHIKAGEVGRLDL